MISAKAANQNSLQALYLNFQKILRCLDFGANMKKRLTLTITQMRVLSFFNEQDVIYISDISRRLDMSMQSVNNVVARLEATGYVARSRNEQDKRLTDIRLTEKGRRSIDSFRSGHIDRLQALMGGLAEKEQRQLIAAIEDAARMLEKAVNSSPNS